MLAGPAPMPMLGRLAAPLSCLKLLFCPLRTSECVMSSMSVFAQGETNSALKERKSINARCAQKIRVVDKKTTTTDATD